MLTITEEIGRHVDGGNGQSFIHQMLFFFFRLVHRTAVSLFVVPLMIQPHELLFALHALIRFLGRMAGYEVPVQVIFEIETFCAHGTRERLVAVVMPELMYLQLSMFAEPLAAHAAPIRFLAAMEPLIVLRLVALVREVFVAQFTRDARGFAQLLARSRRRRRRQRHVVQVHGTAAIADGRVVIRLLLRMMQHQRRWRRCRRYGRHHQQTPVVLLRMIDYARVRAGYRRVLVFHGF